MKRTTIYLLSLLIMIMVAGCSSTPSDQANAIQDEQQEPKDQVAPKEKASVNESQQAAPATAPASSSEPSTTQAEKDGQQIEKQPSPSPTTKRMVTEEKVAGKYKEELLRLQGYYSSQLQSLYSGAVEELKANPNSKKAIYAKYANKGRVLEEESQAKINQLLAKMKAELQANQLPTTTINQYRSTYYTELGQAKNDAMAKVKESLGM